MAVTAPVVLPPHRRKKGPATADIVYNASTSPPAPPVAVSKLVLDFEEITLASTKPAPLALRPQSPHPPPISYIKTPPMATTERARLKRLLHDFLQRFDGDSSNLRATAPAAFYAVLPESLLELFEAARSRIRALQSLDHLAVPKHDQKNVAPAFLVELITGQNQLDGIPGISFTMPVWDCKRLAHAIVMKDLHGFDQALLVSLSEKRECAVCKGMLSFGARVTVLGCQQRCVVHEECVDVGKYARAVAKCPLCQPAVPVEAGGAERVKDKSDAEGALGELEHG